MEDQKARIINYRAFALSALEILCTIFCIVGCFESLWYIIPLVCLVVFVVLYNGIKRSLGKMIFALAVIVIASCSCLISILGYNVTIDENMKYNIECRVDSIYAKYDTTLSVLVSDISINTKKANGKMLLYIYDCEEVNVGDRLTFSSKIKTYEVLDIVKNSNKLYKENVKYRASVNVDSLDIKTGNMTFIESFKTVCKNNIFLIMGERTGGVAYSLLFGDKTLIEEDAYTSFRNSGTAHLLAISGLHISLIIGLLYYIVNKLKMKNIYKFITMFVFLSLYNWLCNFAPSVVRASIMGLTMIGCKLLGKRYDILNSLGLSLSIILIVSPLSLYDVGLLLSYMAVFSIILFGKIANNIKVESKVFKKLLTIVFTTIFVTIMTYPIVANYFGQIALYSVFANVVVIPLFSLAFTCLFVFNIFSIIGLGFFLYVPKALFDVIIFIADIFATIPYSVINVGKISFIVCILIYLGAFTLSRFVMLKISIKVISCFVIFVLCATILLGEFIADTSRLGVYCNLDTHDCVIVSGDDSYLVGAKISKSYNYQISQSLTNNKINSLSGLIITKDDNIEVKYLQNFLLNYPGATVYVPSGHSMIDNLISSRVEYVVYDEGIFLEGNIFLSAKTVNHKTFTNVSVNGYHFIFGADKLVTEDFDMLDYSVDYLCYKNQITSQNINKTISDKIYINCR